MVKMDAETIKVEVFLVNRDEFIEHINELNENSTKSDEDAIYEFAFVWGCKPIVI